MPIMIGVTVLGWVVVLALMFWAAYPLVMWKETAPRRSLASSFLFVMAAMFGFITFTYCVIKLLAGILRLNLSGEFVLSVGFVGVLLGILTGWSFLRVVYPQR